MEERFSIREIARLTGLTPATLRKWEERYEIVHPLRLPNGYREYSRADLAALSWVKAKVEGGSLVSTAAAELKERLGQGWLPDDGRGLEQSAVLGEQHLQTKCQERLLAALLDRTYGEIMTTLDKAFAAFCLDTVLIEIIQPVLYQIGLLWERGTISEYQEHYSSMVLRDRLLALRPVLGGRMGPLFITACLPGEQHEIGSLMLNLLAARQGFNAVHLGASPSPVGLERAVAEMHPAVLALSVATTQRLQEQKRWLEGLGELAPQSELVVGGQGVERTGDLCHRVHLIAGDARESLRLIAHLSTDQPS